MLVLLPLLCFGLLIEVFRKRETDWRRQILFATIPWALFLALSTECLSAFHLITKAGLSLAWLLFLLAVLVWRFRSPTVSTAERETVERSVAVDELERPDRFAIYFVALIVVLIGVTALLAAPNTWDAMEYHMPRVVEWMANRSVQLYPTIDHQQLSMPPMAEYAILHLDLLWGGDRLAGLVQWFAFLGCILGVTLIVEDLGGDRRAQVFAAVVAATVPTAILGASGTKNDQVLAYWIVMSVYFLVRWKRSQDWLHTVALGSSLSLAAFSKGTAYTFLPLLVVACMFMWDKVALRRFFVRLPVFLLLLVVVSAPLWMRCYQFSGSIFGPPYFPGAGSVEIRMIRNSRVTPALVVANVARNVALDVGVPSDRVNDLLTRGFSRFIRVIGVDPDDHGQIVASQSGRFYPFDIFVDSLQETQSSDPIEAMLFFVAGVIYLANFKKMKRATGWLGAGIVGAFFLYAAIVRWSPWNARYQLPIFMLAAAFIALVLPVVLPRRLVLGVSFLLLLCALPFVLRNSTRPLLTRSAKDSLLVMPRDQTYFLDQHKSFATSFITAASAVSAESCRSVGVDANRLRFEYPMLALLSKDGVQRRLSYVSVDNGTERYKSTSAAAPCVVVCLACARAAEKWKEYSDSEPNPSVFGDIVIFRYPNGFEARGGSADSSSAR
jgi:hypothetical protein